MKIEEPKVSEKTFCDVIAMLMKDKETKDIFNKTFERKPECQLKK